MEDQLLPRSFSGSSQAYSRGAIASGVLQVRIEVLERFEGPHAPARPRGAREDVEHPGRVFYPLFIPADRVTVWADSESNREPTD